MTIGIDKRVNLRRQFEEFGDEVKGAKVEALAMLYNISESRVRTFFNAYKADPENWPYSEKEPRPETELVTSLTTEYVRPYVVKQAHLLDIPFEDRVIKQTKSKHFTILADGGKDAYLDEISTVLTKFLSDLKEEICYMEYYIMAKRRNII